uniref:Uncharacterized protein n=1 Tax=Ditylenchus dipsaci TaxID=166011 RepID=A0A915E9R5_9BILA
MKKIINCDLDILNRESILSSRTLPKWLDIDWPELSKSLKGGNRYNPSEGLSALYIRAPLLNKMYRITDPPLEDADFQGVAVALILDTSLLPDTKPHLTCTMKEFIRSIFYVEKLLPCQCIKSLKRAKLQRQSKEAVNNQEEQIAVNVYSRICNLWDSGKGVFYEQISFTKCPTLGRFGRQEAFVHEVAILYALECLPEETQEALLFEARKILREKIQEEPWTNDQIYQLGIESLVETRREFPYCHGRFLIEANINVNAPGRKSYKKAT